MYPEGGSGTGGIIMSQQYPQYTHDPNQQQVQPGQGFGGNPPFGPTPDPQLQPSPKKRRRWIPGLLPQEPFCSG